MTIMHLTVYEAHEARVRIVRRSLLQQVNRQCERENFPFLTLDDLPDIPIVCPLLGLELRRSPYRKPIDESYWVDIIEDGLGYVKGNLQIISYKAYKMRKRGDSTKEK